MGTRARGSTWWRLREDRDRADLTQDELAKKAGISKRQLARYEAGEHIPEPKARQLAEALGSEADAYFMPRPARMRQIEARLDELETDLRSLRDEMERRIRERDDGAPPHSRARHQ